ncbi:MULTISPECIES: hypothetical protein [Flavobacterium]|uniref:Secretion protein n=1 Tax=Flavobacterium hankyongi TaxID=1176532 RepID=A0ABP8ZLJ6_9FLAO|nr:hypothetical protein [Flavobacterium sp. N1846]
MKNLLALLITLQSLISFAANSTEPTSINPVNQTIVDTIPSKKDDIKKGIAGLNIVNQDSKKFGKLAYIVSDNYVEKKVIIYNNHNQEVFSTTTVGDPIFLRNFEKGIYKIKVVEGEKEQTLSYNID